jgi:hypothetical protein
MSHIGQCVRIFGWRAAFDAEAVAAQVHNMVM